MLTTPWSLRIVLQMSRQAELYGPIQAPGFIRDTLSARLGLPKEKIHIRLARMGGGFGVRAYGHHFVEAAVISQMIKAPVKLVYTREDDMTYGIYRPTYTATYKAALDKDNNLIAFHVKGGGIPEHPIHANCFPAGAVDNYLAEGRAIPSNITYRGPEAGLREIDAILVRGDLSDYPLAHSARAELCRKTGRTDQARESWERALALAQQDPERRFINRKLDELGTFPS